MENITTTGDTRIRKEIIQEFKKCERIFELLGDVLNEVHGLDYHTNFWKQITLQYVNTVRVQKKLLDEKVLLNKSADLYPINGYNFASIKQKLRYGLIQLLKHIKTWPNKKRLKRKLENHDTFYFGFPNLPNFQEKENLGVELPLYYPRFIGSGQKDLRIKVHQISERYDDPYLVNIIRRIPRIFVEHFSSIHDSIAVSRPKEKTFHVHFNGSVYNDILVAKYVQHGAKLIWYQHGSYDSELQTRGYLTQLSCVDEFRTWGWSTREKEVPWKAYRLEEFRIKYAKYKKRGNTAEYDIMMCFPQISVKNRDYYRTQTDLIFNNLSPSKYSKILARPRRSNKIHSHAYKLRFINDSRVKITSGLMPMMKEMADCKIVLQMQVPATNFLECMYVDHPTIGLLRNDQPKDLIIPYYNFFLDQGVLHDDFESLVAHLNNVDIDEWWQKVMNHPMYSSFKNTCTRKV